MDKLPEDHSEHPEHINGSSRERILNVAELLKDGAEIKGGRLELTREQVEAAHDEMNSHIETKDSDVAGSLIEAEQPSAPEQDEPTQLIREVLSRRLKATAERVSTIEAGLEGKSIGEKVEFIRAGLTEIEVLLSTESEGPADAELTERKAALEAAFERLIRANAHITDDGYGDGNGKNRDGSPIDWPFVANLYINSVTRYVGDELTKGRPLDDIQAHKKISTGQYSAARWELDVMDQFRRCDDLMGGKYPDNVFDEVVRSFRGQRSTNQQATSEKRNWIMLSGSEENYKWRMAHSDVRDSEPEDGAADGI